MAINETGGALQISALKQGRGTVRLIGQTGFYSHALSAKAMRTLLVGGAKKTAAERKEIKHDPVTEFRDCIYRHASGPTLVGFPAPGVKGAMATAALQTPGVKKTDVQRHIFLPDYWIKMWGRPYLKMDIVRSADMAKTPDVRTRAFLPRWVAEVDIAFTMPVLSTYSVVTLLANAGMIAGIGDFRQEKGRGCFGTFAVAGSADMGEFQDYWDEIAAEGRDVQQAAMDSPECEPGDTQTQQLLEFLAQEKQRRA